MKTNGIVSKLSGAFHKAGFGVRRHGPEILVAVGIVGTVVSAVMACKATTKLSGILNDAEESLEKIRKASGDETLKEQYSEEDAKKDRAIVRIQTGVKIAKLYAPSVAVGVLSVTCVLASHDILRKRNVALAAAYTAVDKGFKEYRSRVVERFGERVDKELRHNIKAEEVTETVTDDKTGEPKEVKKAVDTVDGKYAPSEYARIFEACSACRDKNHDYNMSFVRSQQQFANDRLKAKGYIFLNDVYDSLGIPRTKAGQIVGWIYDPKNPVGDNFVDFGIREVYQRDDPCPLDENEWERVILLDFNVDGPILDKIL